MPELPEVEAIRMQLEQFLVGHIIVKVDVNSTRTFPDDQSHIIGAKVTAVRRFGKVTVIDLDNKKSLMVHVKMTGQFVYRGPNLPHPKPLSRKIVGGVPGVHTRVVFYLDHEGILYYNDFRAFGWMRIVDTKDVESTGLVGKMGPEPFRDLTIETFKTILGKTKSAIKVVLMDQTRMSGVGNIYANDALWLSQILPTRPANSLNESEQNALFAAIESVLKEGMKYGGSSENAFVTPDGTEGQYQRHTLVYGKTGNLCTRCKQAKIIKTMLGGRGTYTCTFCQK